MRRAFAALAVPLAAWVLTMGPTNSLELVTAALASGYQLTMPWQGS